MSVESNSAPPTEDGLLGALVAERYRVLSKLGEGGMGAVYRVEHVHLRKVYALKLLRDGKDADEETVARFQREAQAAAHLEHENIARCIDYGELPGHGGLFLVMEFVQGVSLRKLLTPGQPMEAQRVVLLTQQIAAGLGCAHGFQPEGVVHRDLKPENVVVSDGDRVKLIDFGIARARSSSFGGGAATALTRAGIVMGTPSYMAPEQAVGQSGIDGRADQYALGVMVFEMLTGTLPFDAPDALDLIYQHVGAPIPKPSERNPALSPAVDAAVMRMMGKLPRERFDTVKEAYLALETALLGARGSAVPPQPAAAPPVPTPPAFGPSPTAPGATVALRVAPAPAAMMPPPTSSLPVAPPHAAPAAPQRASAPNYLWALPFALLALLFPVYLGVRVLRSVSGAAAGDAGVSASSAGNLESVLATLRGPGGEHHVDELEAHLREHPESASDPRLAQALSELFSQGGPGRHAAERALERSSAGRSAPVAQALAAQLLDSDLRRDQRDALLRQLRDRVGYLTPEQRARVQLRDAEDCVSFATACAVLGTMREEGARQDLARVGRSDCAMLRRGDALCRECSAAGNNESEQGDNAQENGRGGRGRRGGGVFTWPH